MRRADLLEGVRLGPLLSNSRTFTMGIQACRKVDCAFIAAFLYETELNDKEMVEKLYLQVIELYPPEESIKQSTPREQQND